MTSLRSSSCFVACCGSKLVTPVTLPPGRSKLATKLSATGSTTTAKTIGIPAVIEFQKVLDHPGVVQNNLIGALARLQLARAYMMSGDAAKAKAAYQDFLTLWKDADPDIPILKQAKAEYAKLQ